MTIILNAALTTAQTAVASTALEFRDGNPESAAIQGNFVYGSGGTSATVWVQTSVDQGNTWIDVANFAFTTASGRFLYNLSALTPVSSQYTPTDGAMASNTAHDGVLGNLWRTKLTTTGTYAGTSLRVDMSARGRLTS